MKVVNLGFLPKVVEIDLDKLLPLKVFSKTVCKAPKFLQIASSIREVGLIEPLVVTSLDRRSGKHAVLDGHLRFMALREIGQDSAPCLISTDDEAYTYNKRVNRLSSLQEHVMLRRAVDRGVPPERLAKVLNVNIDHLTSKLNLVKGICPEVLQLLRDREFSPVVAGFLRRMKPLRQIECVEMMVASNTMTVSYAKALLAVTEDDMLVSPRPSRQKESEESLKQMERETAGLRARYRMVEQTYADDVLNLVVTRGYVGKLVANEAIKGYLSKWHGELLPELQATAAIGSLDE